MSGELAFLDGPLRDAVVEASWRELQPSATQEAYFALARGVMGTEWGRRRWRVPVLRDDGGDVVASMSLFDLAVRLDNARLRLAGIGALRVRPDRRGMGLGRFFLKAVHDRVQEEGFDGGLLFSSIGPAYFARMGYEVLPVGVLVADLASHRDVHPTPATASRIRPFEPADFDAVRNIYNTTASLQRLALLRDDEYWDASMLRSTLAERLLEQARLPASFLVGERDGRVVSYLRAARSPADDALVVEECGFDSGAREDVTAMIRHLLEQLEPTPPRALRAVGPSRMANLVPAHRMAWKRETQRVMMMKSFGSFQAPTDLAVDDRNIWACDWF